MTERTYGTYRTYRLPGLAQLAWAGVQTALTAMLAAIALTTTAQAAPLKGNVCHLPGQEAPLQCTSVVVPRDYARPQEGSLTLHVTIAPAFREKAKADPVFVLAGGPGQSGSSIIFLLDAGLQRVRATRDIIFIDQRGTGKSGKLTCDALQRTDTLDADQAEREMVTCLTSLRPEVRYYSTEAAANDMERVRIQLGFAQINLWGGSYGTRLAQAYAHQFPQRLRSMVLDGVTSPQQNIGLMGFETGRAFQLLRESCEKDSACKARFPKFGEQLDALVARARKGDTIIRFRHPVTGKPEQQPLRFENFAESIRTMLYQPQMAMRLPWMVQQAAQDNWQPLIAASVVNHSWQQDDMALGLTLAVLCGEDIAHITPEQAQAEINRSFLADSWTKKMQRWCAVLDLPPRARPASSPLQVPTLVLSGQRDPVTPPQRGQEASALLPRSQHLIVEQVGHIVTPHGCTARLLRQFFDEPGKKVDGACLKEIGRAPFVMSAAGAEP